MVLSSEVTAHIKEVLEKHPEGLSITDLVRLVDINRNTAGRYLENLLLSGQVEMRRFGMAKMYTLAKRLPVSSVLSISSELVMQLVHNQRIIYANDKLLTFLGATAKDLIGKNLEFSQFAVVFEDVFPELLDRFRRGLKGEEWHGELSRPIQGRSFFCRVAPTVSNEGTKGVSVLLEDITDQKRDEVRIRESEARLRGIFMVSPVGIGMAANRIFHEVNDRFCQITGYSSAELLGKSARILYPSDEVFEEVGATIMRQIREHGSSSVETQWVKKDGTIIDIFFSSTPLDPANISGGITFTAMDITDRRRAERELRESEEKFRALFNNANDMITLHGFDRNGLPGQYLEVNDEACRTLNYTRDELLRLSPKDIVAPESAGEINRNVKLLKKNGHATFEIVHMTKDGQRIPVEISAHLFEFYGQTMVLALVRNIAERKRIEEVLREREKRLTAAQRIARLGDVSLDIGTGKVTWSQGMYDLVQYDSSVKINDRINAAIHHPDDQERLMRWLHDAISSGSDVLPQIEYRIIRKDGRILVVHTTGEIQRIDGKAVRAFVTLQDITERKLAEDALRESEQKYRHLVEQSLQGLTILQDGRPVFANPAMLNISGYTHDEYLALSAEEMMATVHPDDRHRIAAVMADRLNGKKFAAENEFRILRKDGEIRWVLTHGSLISYHGMPAIQIAYFDITGRKRAEQALRESESTARALLNAPTDTILLLDRSGVILDLNETAALRLGKKREDLIGLLSDTALPMDLAQERRRKISEVFNTKKPVRFTDENRDTWFDNVAYPILDNQGHVARLAIIARDITDQKRMEAALRVNETRYRTLSEASQDLIFLIGSDDRVEYVNSYAAEALGLPVDKVIGQKRTILFSGEQGQRQTNALRRVFDTGKAGRSEGAMEISGSLHWFDHYLNPIRDENGKVTSVLGVSRDITNRKHTEQALFESEARLRQITETLTSVFYIHERASDRFIYVSPAYEQIWKRSRQSLYDDPYTYLEAVHPDDKPRLLESIRQELEESRYVDREYRIMQPDGTIRWIHAKNFPVFDKQGKAYRVAGIAEDITSRRAAEDALKESEDRYRKLVDISPNAVLLHQDGKIIYANRALARILGTKNTDDFLGKNVLDLIHPAYREAIRANIAQDLTGASTPFMELQMIRSDGSPVFVEGQGVSTTIEGKPAVLVAINDITGRYQAGQALKESEERYRNLAEVSQDLIFVIGRDDRVEYVNSCAAAILGLPADQVIGKERRSLFHGETGERQERELRRVFGTGNAGRSEGPLQVSGTVRWFDHHLMPIKDARGTVTSVLGVSRDITDRRQDGSNRYQGGH